MNILLIGATGLIGAAISARLVAAGHRVVGVARHASGDHNGMTWRTLDLAAATAEDWTPLLYGMDAVVNCAGLLQDTPGSSIAAVHAAGPAVLFRACVQAGVRRVIHFSAVGVDRETPTEFSRSKRAGDEALMALELDWVILRPSVVIGRGAYGASALMRGLAALPVLPVMPLTAPLQIIHLDDVVDATIHFLKPDASTRVVVELVGPRRYRFEEVVRLLRRWMRWPSARRLAVPRWLAGFTYRLGDAVALIGWRPPVRSTAQREMVRGAVGDPAPLTELTGIKPRDLESALAREPASVQERWFARLYLLKPLIFVVFAAFWIVTGLVSLGPGRERGIALVMDGGVSRAIATLLTLSGGAADIIIGLAIAVRRTARIGLYAAFAISITYAVIGTVLVPWMWLDPLGPMLKIGPILVFNLVALAILDDR